MSRSRFGVLRIKKPSRTFWLIFGLTVWHMDTEYLSQLPVIGDILDMGKLVSFASILLLYLIKHKLPSKMAVAIIFMDIYILAITVINKGAIYRYAIVAFSITSVVLLYDLFLRYDTEDFLSAQLLCFEIVIYINLVTEILFPEGMYYSASAFSTFASWDNWFLGYYNRHSKFFVPALAIAFLYSDYTGKKMRTYLLLAVMWISALLVWSGGVLLSLGVMTLILFMFGKNTRLFNYYNYWMLHVIFFVSIICLKVQNVFYWLIDGILHKWSSLSGRVRLWDITLELVRNNIFWGQGYKNGNVRSAETGMTWGTYAHNMVLEVLYRGGIVYIILYIICIIMCGKKLMKYKDTRAGIIISGAFAGWCVCNLVEFYTSGFLHALFIVGYYWGDIEKKRSGEEKWRSNF